MATCGDVAAERAILAGIFKYGSDAYIDVADIVTTRSFTVLSNEVIFSCIKHLVDNDVEKMDYPSILSASKALGIGDYFDRQDEQKHLRAIMQMPVEKENVRKFAVQIRKLEIARVLGEAHSQASKELQGVTGKETIEHILGISEKPSSDFASLLLDDEGPTSIGQGISEHFNWLHTNPRDIAGISTGYPLLDAAMGGGMRGKTLTIVGARPGVGKTSIAYNVGNHVGSILNLPVLNLDTEMCKEDNWLRMVSTISGVPIRTLERGNYTLDVQRKIKPVIDKLKQSNYDYYNIAGQPFEDTLAVMRRWHKKRVKEGPSLIIFDYIKLMSDERLAKNISETQAIGFITTGLHNFMVRHDASCLAFVQLNRDGIDGEDTDVIAQSDRILWFCATLALFKRKTDEELVEQPDWNRKLTVLKARYGPGLMPPNYINMQFDGPTTRLVEGPTRRQVEGKDEPTVF